MLYDFSVSAESDQNTTVVNACPDTLVVTDAERDLTSNRKNANSQQDFAVISSESSAGLDLDMHGLGHQAHRDVRDHCRHEMSNNNSAALFSSLSPTILSDEEDIDIDDPDEIYATALEQQMMFDSYDVHDYTIYDTAEDLAPIKSMEMELQDGQNLSNHQTQAGLRIVSYAAASENNLGGMTPNGDDSFNYDRNYEVKPNPTERKSFDVIPQQLVMLVASTPEIEMRFRQDSFLKAGVCSCLVEVY